MPRQPRGQAQALGGNVSDLIDEVKPDRVAVDSLSALERVFSLRSFREFVISLTSTLKAKTTAGLFTSTT